VTEQLWAPWRLEYLESADDAGECIFCSASDLDEAAPESLLVARGETALVILNK
jgi:ATP adenylyltransferase